MNQIERRDAGLAYISDDSVFEEQKKCRQILQKLNFIDRSDFAGISEIVKELFGKSEGAFVNPPFIVTTAATSKSAKISLPTIIALFWMLQRSRLVTTARWHQMSQSTQLAIQFIQLAEILPMSTVKKSQSVTMYGSAATPLSARVYTLETMLSSVPEAL